MNATDPRIAARLLENCSGSVIKSLALNAFARTPPESTRGG